MRIAEADRILDHGGGLSTRVEYFFEKKGGAGRRGVAAALELRDFPARRQGGGRFFGRAPEVAAGGIFVGLRACRSRRQPGVSEGLQKPPSFKTCWKSRRAIQGFSGL